MFLYDDPYPSKELDDLIDKAYDYYSKKRPVKEELPEEEPTN